MRGIIKSASKGLARQRIPGPRSHHGQLADELEGFTRSFIMAGPWLSNKRSSFVYEGAEYNIAEFYARGILSGTDPDHPEYWGDIGDFAQHLVEMAALSWSLYLSKEMIWDKYSNKEKKQVADYLFQCTKVKYHQNNWLLFNVITNSVLKRLEMPYSQEQIDNNLKACDHMYIGGGWYRDGNINRIDYYNAWAFLYYYLQWVILDGDSYPEETKKHIERTKLFVDDLKYFIASDGATPCFGRSMIYRFAFLGPVALGQYMNIFNNDQGEIKTLCNLVMSFFFSNPIISDNDHLSLGYLSPSAEILEHYSCGGSPYWAAKAFNMFLLHNDNDFWSAQEKELPIHKGSFSRSIENAGLVLYGDKKSGQIQLINHKSYHDKPEYNAKYTKFAYSSIFSYEARSVYKNFNCDNILQFSEDGIKFKQRWEMDNLYCTDHFSASRYNLFEVDPEGVAYSATIIKDGYLINIHEIISTKPLFYKEGGYPLGFDSGYPEIISGQDSEAAIINNKFTYIRNLYGYSQKIKASQFCDDISGSNVRYNRSVVPALAHEADEGKIYLASLVYAGIGTPALDELSELIKEFTKENNCFKLKFTDNSEIFVQLGIIGEINTRLLNKSINGKVVFAYAADENVGPVVIYENNELR
jgi:hypothetical protein